MGDPLPTSIPFSLTWSISFCKPATAWSALSIALSSSSRVLSTNLPGVLSVRSVLRNSWAIFSSSCGVLSPISRATSITFSIRSAALPASPAAFPSLPKAPVPVILSAACLKSPLAASIAPLALSSFALASPKIFWALSLLTTAPSIFLCAWVCTPRLASRPIRRICFASSI